MNPRFLSLARVLELHAESILHYGCSPGVRDMGLLESALAQPQAGFAGQYVHESFAEMAAAYLYHVVNKHPFIDGNEKGCMRRARDVLVRGGLSRHAVYDRLD